MENFAFFIQKYIFYLLIWELVWKGFALWKSAKRNEYIWFVVMLVVNSMGILPIIYIIYDKYLREKVTPLIDKYLKKRT